MLFDEHLPERHGRTGYVLREGFARFGGGGGDLDGEVHTESAVCQVQHVPGQWRRIQYALGRDAVSTAWRGTFLLTLLCSSRAWPVNNSPDFELTTVFSLLIFERERRNVHPPFCGARREREGETGDREAQNVPCYSDCGDLAMTRNMSKEKKHDHEHEHQAVPSDLALRVKSLESLLVEKGLVDRAALDALIDTYEHKIGPRNGARVVARAWADPAYKQRLLTDADTAIAELGYGGMQGEHMVVIENSAKVHNLVVCTLCSCYPWPVLGLPPVWYKSAPYRSRAVIDPRGVLREFGLELAEDVEVRVWDSTAELRYLVLPERPAGSANLSEEELAALVTRDSMVGVGRVAVAQAGGRE